MKSEEWGTFIGRFIFAWFLGCGIFTMLNNPISSPWFLVGVVIVSFVALNIWGALTHRF